MDAEEEVTAVARKLDAAPRAAPIVKWAGGKSKLLPELMARVPKSFGRYFEPFAGGAALFFRLAPAFAVLSDVNFYLISAYRAVAHDVDAVICRLGMHRRQHDEAHYYETRARWNRDVTWSAVDRAAAFIYLNKTCYNGLWRVNRSGAFNVPMGRYRDPTICDSDALRAAAPVLAAADLRCGDFAPSIADAGRGDFVYFDPPYDPVSSSSNFTGYTAGGFGSLDQGTLAKVAMLLVNRGVKVMLSNSDTPFIRSLYPGFRVDAVTCKRSINSKATGRGEVGELIIMGGYEPQEDP